ncbi:MAG: hypothetical protein V4739_15570 [Pseudomonadota bacterium]
MTPTPDPLPARPRRAFALSKESTVSLAGGVFMGLVVLGISTTHGGSLLGLTLAVVYVLAAAASLVLFMLSWSRPKAAARPSVHAWVGWQALGALMTLHMLPLF